MSPRYLEFPPPPELTPWIACFWIYENPSETDGQPVVPDGRCELILQLASPYREVGEVSDQPAMLLAGQLTRPLQLVPTGPIRVLAARFRTEGAHAYVQQPSDTLTDQRTPLGLLKGPRADRLLARAIAAKGDAARLALLASHIWEEVRSNPVDAVLTQAVEALRAGPFSLAGLSAATGLSPRALQRLFALKVGLPPRELASILRFRRVFDALADTTVETWTAAAQAAGYFDHPQMARDFQRFVGCSASDFVANRGGLAAHLVANLQGAAARPS